MLFEMENALQRKIQQHEAALNRANEIAAQITQLMREIEREAQRQGIPEEAFA